MTVAELICLLTEAYAPTDRVYVENADENLPQLLESVDKNAYAWGFVIGKVE